MTFSGSKTDQGIAANQLHTEAEEKNYLAESILARPPGGLRRHSRPGEEKEFISSQLTIAVIP